MPRLYKEKILRLKEQHGLTYREIARTLNCSISTISYYLGEEQSNKAKNRLRKFRSLEENIAYDTIKARYNGLVRRVPILRKYGPKQLFVYLYSIKTCHITGLPIDYTDRKSWEIDHIVPVYSGGTNDLENLAPCLVWANRLKGSFSVEELKDKCGIVFSHLSKQHGLRDSNSR